MSCVKTVVGNIERKNKRGILFVEIALQFCFEVLAKFWQSFGKVRFRLNIDVRERKVEDSRLNAIKQPITFVKGRLHFSSKSTTEANVDLTQSLLHNWLKNNSYYR